MYKVIEYFTDLQDNGYPYYPGEAYPRNGLKVSENRYKELSTTNNKRRKVLIVKVDEPKEAEKKQARKDKKNDTGRNAVNAKDES